MPVFELFWIGNLVADPDLSELPDRGTLARLRIAAQSRQQVPSTGRWKDDETTLSVVAWRSLADSLQERGEPSSVDRVAPAPPASPGRRAC